MSWSPPRGSLRSSHPSRLSLAARFAAGLLLLVLLDQLGKWLVAVAHAAIPGSVVGMLLLTVLLELRVLPVPVMRPAGELLVRHLALLYVPAGVALIAYAAAVRHDLLAIVVAGTASLAAVLVVVGMVVQRLERSQ